LAITMFVFAAAIFRSEVALLLGTTILYLLIIPATSLERIVFPFCVAFFISLLISIPLDSYFWQKPLWPELWGFYYNAILGSSSLWGVSPWHYYFTSALPRLLNGYPFLLLLPISLRNPALAPAAKRLAISSLLFVAAYSVQPHKEARFILYVVPPLTAAAALSAAYIFNRRGKGPLPWLMATALILAVLASFASSTAMLLISSLNYPGGEALAHLRSIVQADAAGSSFSAVVPVHADVLSCMTGVTLFGTAMGSTVPTPRVSVPGQGLVGREHGASAGQVSLLLDKTEDEVVLATEDFWRRFDYVLMEDPRKAGAAEEWETAGIVTGFSGIEILKPGHSVASEEHKEYEIDEIVGKGAVVEKWKRKIIAFTGGWWIGPKMKPAVYILRRVKDVKGVRESAGA